MSELVNKYRNFSENCSRLITSRTFELGTQNTDSNIAHTVAHVLLAESKYNSVSGKIPLKMERIDEKTFSIKIRKTFDLYRNNLVINMYPGERLAKVTVKIYDEELESVTNPANGEISLITELYTPRYGDIIIEVRFEKVQYEEDRLAWIDAVSYNQEVVRRVNGIWSTIYDLREPREEEKRNIYV